MAIDQPRNQSKRRAVYGLNVAVAIAAAVAVVVLINVVVDWQYNSLPPRIKDFVRYDLTATRAHTLAPQTRNLLAGLDADREMVAILRVDDRDSQDVADLLAEYARYSPHLDLTLIHPDREPTRLEAFYQSIEHRYDDQTGELRAAIVAGLGSVDQLIEDLAALRESFKTLADDPVVTDGETRERLELFAVKLEETERVYADLSKQLGQVMASPLPPLSSVRSDLLGAFRKAEGQVLGQYQRLFKQMAQQRDAPMKVRDALLRMDGPIEAARRALRPAIDALTLPADPSEYDRLVASMRAGEVIVVLGPDAARVVPVSEMFAQGSDVDEAGQPVRQFLGEDRLTGALLTMQMATPPRVVFVRDGPNSAVSPEGGFAYIGSRLATADFEVAEWIVGGGQGGAQATLPPLPADGQAAVWIVPPLSLERTTQADRENVATVLRKRLTAGDGVMLLMTYDAEALFRPADPLAELSKQWGMTPRLHELILREGLGPDRRPSPDAGFVVHDWPDDSPLASALSGRTAQFVAASPLQLPEGGKPPAGLTVHPLVALPGERVWSVTGVTTPQQIASSSYSPEAALKSPVIAAAAQREAGGRLVATTERYWPTDRQATRLLGNSEMMINGIYWLAGLDDAIAATPRTQDIRRIGAMSDRQTLTYRLLLLAGLPGLALGTGVVVWMMRRRG